MAKNALCKKEKEVQTISSLEVAEMLGRNHSEILKEIEGRKDGKNVGIIPALEKGNFHVSDYFIESTYKAQGNNKTYKCYLVTKMGCELLGNKQQGEKGIIFTAKYVERFNKMEQALKEQQPKQQVDTKSKDTEARLINAKVRQASMFLKIADKVNIPAYQQVMYSKATEVLDGKALIPLPKAERETYSATDIGEKLGISSNKVGTLAIKHNLKTDEYGEWVHDKSKYSSKQVRTFRYYDNVIPVMENLISEEVKGA